MRQAIVNQLTPLDYAGTEALNTICTNLTFAGRDLKKIVFTSNTQSEGKSYMIMDVGETERQLLVLENQTSTKNPTSGRRYLAYAYVDGQYMYNSVYYPKLIALYIDYAS